MALSMVFLQVVKISSLNTTLTMSLVMDILILPLKLERNTKAVIIEIKATSNEEDMDELAAKALSQIEEKNYALPFSNNLKDYEDTLMA